jgi:hypothetical protein
VVLHPLLGLSDSGLDPSLYFKIVAKAQSSINGIKLGFHGTPLKVTNYLLGGIAKTYAFFLARRKSY